MPFQMKYFYIFYHGKSFMRFISIFLLLLGLVSLSSAAVPVVGNVTLNSTFAGNYTPEDLTVYWDSYDADADNVTNITNWYMDSSSIMVLNMPFERSNSTLRTRDYSPYGNNASEQNGVAWNATGGPQGDGSFYFDGTNDYIYVGTQSSLKDHQNLTIEAWLKPLAPTAQGAVIANIGSYHASGGYQMVVGGSMNLGALFRDSTYNDRSTASTVPLASDVWQHVAAVFAQEGSNTRITLYINGTYDKDQLFTGTINYDNVDAVRIGTNYDGKAKGGSFDREYKGSIGAIRVYNRSLTPEQIWLLSQDRTDMISFNETDAGDVWQACVTPNDGSDDGEQNCSNGLTVQSLPSFLCGTNLTYSVNFTGNLKNSSGGEICPDYGLIIGASNVVVDCKGYSMTGNGGSINDSAFVLDNVTNVTIRNCDINEFGYKSGTYPGMISLQHANYTTIDNVNLSSSQASAEGLAVRGITSYALLNNSRISSSLYAISIAGDDVDDNVFADSYLQTALGYTVGVSNGDDNLFEGLNLTAGTGRGYTFSGTTPSAGPHGNIVRMNNISVNENNFVILDANAYGNTLEDSYLHHPASGSLVRAIYLAGPATISGNTIVRDSCLFDNAVELNSNDVLFQDNNVTCGLQNNAPLQITSGSNINVSGNRFISSVGRLMEIETGVVSANLTGNYFGPRGGSLESWRIAAGNTSRILSFADNVIVGPELDVDGFHLDMLDTTFRSTDGTADIVYENHSFNGSANFYLDESNFFVRNNITSVDPSSAALDLAFNSTARPYYYGVDCGLFSIHYNSSFLVSGMTSSDVVATNADIGGNCDGGVCTGIQCSAGTLSFTVPSWSSFGSGNASSPSNVTGIGLYGANITNASTHARYNGTATAGNATTEGGNITGLNISSTALTDKWAAFYGNVSGSILLTGAAGVNNVYSWAWSPADGGTVCVSTNSSLSQLSASGAQGSDIDSAWGFPASVDSGINTFNLTNCTMGIGSSSITNASYADTGPAGGFITCSLKSAPAPAKPQLLFCSDIISGGTSWNGVPSDFELMVPTNSTAGATETYYFYANLG